LSSSNPILVSIIIPVKNGAHWLRQTLQSLQDQELNGAIEIIVIDSGSTDRTLEIVRTFPVRLIQIEPAEFNHGLTRNLGVSAALGEYVVMTVQDARPADPFWLQKMVDSFDVPEVAGVCGAQVVPHEPGNNPVEWFRPVSTPKVRSFQFRDPTQFESLTPDEKRRACAWDNVTAMYRREVLQILPFRQTNFAEDALWARDALHNGYKIVYNPAARVYHYHFEDKDFAFRRSLTVFYHMYRYFGVLPTASLLTLKRKLSIARILMKEKSITLEKKYFWYKYNINLNKAICKSAKIFQKALQQGEAELDRLHNEYCKRPPMAKSFVVQN
jgi:rhamnosyltransferase